MRALLRTHPELREVSDLLEEGLVFSGSGKPKRAIRALERALGLVRAMNLVDPPARDLQRRVAEALLSAWVQAGRKSEIGKHDEDLVRAGIRETELVRIVTHRLAIEQKRTDAEALDLYVAAIESGVALERPVRERLNQILAFSLHVRLNSTAASTAHLVPLLERLHRARPQLNFVRLYLGRYHYLRREYATARTYLEPIDGRLGSSPKVLNVLGRCCEKLGLAAQAAESYRRSLAEDFHQPHIHFRIGRVLLRQFQAMAPEL
jgi:uncharacterized protein HemY